MCNSHGTNSLLFAFVSSYSTQRQHNSTTSFYSQARFINSLMSRSTDPSCFHKQKGPTKGAFNNLSCILQRRSAKIGLTALRSSLEHWGRCGPSILYKFININSTCATTSPKILDILELRGDERLSSGSD